MSYVGQGLPTEWHYGSWGAAVVWVLLFGFFIAFIPFHKKAQRRPASIFLAFIVASAFEMFGIPLSLYLVAWAFGVSLPEGLLWGHTLQQYIGYWGMYFGSAISFAGAFLVYHGWKAVYRSYWGKEEGEGKLVADGVYAYMRHPQYTGFMLITLGLLVHWATIPLLVMWPILAIQYYRLARREEKEMEERFGDEYRAYRERVPMFIPHPR
jgi:protein-S-isoprenylcysteine O-methyltransferase Ste14